MDVVEIYLNSKTTDKQNGTANCVFHLPNIEVAKDEVAYINVKQAVIPFSWYNVNAHIASAYDISCDGFFI